MPAPFEFGLEPGVDNADGLRLADHSFAEGNHIGVVVLFAQPGTVHIPTNGATNTPDFVGDDGLAIPAASKDNPQVSLTPRHALGRRPDKIGIVHGRFAVSPKINNLVPGECADALK